MISLYFLLQVCSWGKTLCKKTECILFENLLSMDFFLFFLNFLFGPRSILWSHWLLLFWTLCVLPHGFQIQSGYLTCTLSCLHAVILKVTTGATPAFSTNRGVHCISMYTAWLARLLSHALGFKPPTQWWAAQRCMTKSDALPTELFRRNCSCCQNLSQWFTRYFFPKKMNTSSTEYPSQ